MKATPSTLTVGAYRENARIQNQTSESVWGERWELCEYINNDMVIKVFDLIFEFIE